MNSIRYRAGGSEAAGAKAISSSPKQDEVAMRDRTQSMTQISFSKSSTAVKDMMARYRVDTYKLEVQSYT